MNTISKLVFMALFLASVITMIQGVRALITPAQPLPTPRVIAAVKSIARDPSEVNRRELNLAIAESQTLTGRRRVNLVIALGVLAIALLGLGRELNRLHEQP